jgi:transposase
MKRQTQGDLLTMEKFREILRLHELGHSQCAIAQSCAVARSTVQDYVRRANAKGLSYSALSTLSDSEAKELLGKGVRKNTPVVKTIDYGAVDIDLRAKGVTLALLWQEGIDKGSWNLSYATFCRGYQLWRGHQNLAMRQVHKGGEKLFVDYSGMTVALTDADTGEVRAVQIFVACLGASNYIYAEATPTQELCHWIASHQRVLAFLGGVPRCIVPDNLKSAVTAACHYEPGINRTYHDFAEHYGVAIMPARPYKPRDKAKVEKAVQEVERQILAPLRTERFTSIGALNDAIAIRLRQLNERVMRSYGLSRQALFLQVDQPNLQALPTQPFVFAQWKQAKVSPDYHIEVERHYYSVPYWFVQRSVCVKTSEHLVEIFFDAQRIAAHPRCRTPYRHTTLSEHMPPEHWAYKQQSKERFVAWAQQIGAHTLSQVEAIFALRCHEEQAFRTLRGLQSLGQKYGLERLEAACRRANDFGMVGVRRIRAILVHQLDQADSPPQATPLPLATHDNVRGAKYYG